MDWPEYVVSFCGDGTKVGDVGEKFKCNDYLVALEALSRTQDQALLSASCQVVAVGNSKYILQITSLHVFKRMKPDKLNIHTHEA